MTALSKAHADAVGLEFIEGQAAVDIFQRIHVLQMGDALGAKVLEQLWEPGEGPPGFSIFPMRGARGNYEGYETYLATRIKDTNQVDIFLLFQEPLQEQFLVTPEGLVARLAKKFFKMQDLQAGHPELDPKVIIRSERPERTQQRLESDSLQKALLALFTAHPQAAVNDVGVRATLSKPSIEELTDSLGLFKDVADALGEI